MTKQVINIGTTNNDKSGDPIRTAFNKVNENFTELYSTVLSTGDLSFSGGRVYNSTGGETFFSNNSNTSATSFLMLPSTSENGVPLKLTTLNQNGYIRLEVNPLSANQKYWDFAKDGSLTFKNSVGVPTIGGSTDKIRLFNFNNPLTTNYAIGVEADHVWFSLDDATNMNLGWKFYAGEQLACKIGSDGHIELRNKCKILNPINGTLVLQAANGNGVYSDWTFTPDGKLDFPEGAHLFHSYNVMHLSNTNTDITLESVNDILLSTGISGSPKEFKFDSLGILHIPTGGDIKNSTGTSVLFGNQQVNTTNDVSFNSVSTARTTTSLASVYCQPGQSTVFYTASNTFIMTLKMIVQVEGVEDTNTQWDTHSCEIMIAKSFLADNIASNVYGTAHTSVLPLATFTASWNATIQKIEVSCTPANVTQGVYVKSFVTEILTSD